MFYVSIKFFFQIGFWLDPSPPSLRQCLKICNFFFWQASLSGSVFVFCHIDSIFRSNTALLFYWVCSRFMTRFWKHKKSFAACYRAAIIQTFVHYKLNILWTLFVARLHCKFSKVSMFEYNFNFVKTFLIWCFQDFTKSKFIQTIYFEISLINEENF